MTIGRINKYPEQNFFFHGSSLLQDAPSVFFAVTGALFYGTTAYCCLFYLACAWKPLQLPPPLLPVCISQCEDGQLITDNLLQIRIGHFRYPPRLFL